jgi:hypothetical protein
MPWISSSSIAAGDCRTYDASAKRVWSALTDCRHHYLWWPAWYDFRVRECALPQILRTPPAPPNRRHHPFTGPRRPGARGADDESLGSATAGHEPAAFPHSTHTHTHTRAGELHADDRAEDHAELWQYLNTGDLRIGGKAGHDSSTVVDIDSAHGMYTLEIAAPTEFHEGETSTVTLLYGGERHGGVFEGEEIIKIDPLPPDEDGRERCRLCWQAELIPRTTKLRTLARFVSEAGAREYFDPLFDGLAEFLERGIIHEEPHPRVAKLGHDHQTVWQALVSHAQIHGDTEAAAMVAARAAAADAAGAAASDAFGSTTQSDADESAASDAARNPPAQEEASESEDTQKSMTEPHR